ncbi:unnamed protein product, partial [Sphacelaria rigidula]
RENIISNNTNPNPNPNTNEGISRTLGQGGVKCTVGKVKTRSANARSIPPPLQIRILGNFPGLKSSNYQVVNSTGSFIVEVLLYRTALGSNLVYICTSRCP